MLMGDSTTSYGIGVDIWSIGCIFAELHTKVPFFEGVCEISQLFEIFEVCGTPTKSDWAAIDSMPHYQYDLFPKWQRLSMNFVARMEKSWQKYKIRHEPLSVTALNLLEKMLVYEPGQRIMCKEMLKNVYFKDVTNPAISPTPSTDLKPNATKKIKLEEKKVFPQLVHPKLSKI